MATIVVRDFNDVTVNGVSAGSVTDVLKNNSNVAGIGGDLFKALQAWKAAREQAQAADVQAIRDAHATTLAARDQAHAADVQAIKDAHATTLANRDEEIAKLQDLVDRMGGTAEGIRLAKEARRQAALDVKAAADAELAVLDAEAR